MTLTCLVSLQTADLKPSNSSNNESKKMNKKIKNSVQYCKRDTQCTVHTVVGGTEVEEKNDNNKKKKKKRITRMKLNWGEVCVRDAAGRAAVFRVSARSIHHQRPPQSTQKTL